MEKKRLYTIVSIPLGFSRGYLITWETRAILVDTGQKKQTKSLTAVLKQKNLSYRDLTHIVLTHSHYDHVGGLAELRQKSDAKVVVHKEEAGYLRNGYTPFPKGTSFFSKLISNLGSSLSRKTTHYEPVEPDVIVKDRYEIAKDDPHVYVMHTPGHTDGSVSVIVDDTHAFVGDTMFNIFPHTVFPPFANDVPTLLTSWRNLIETGCTQFYPGHGRPFPVEKLVKNYDRIEKRWENRR
jgi:glyoxylase-like metal-dependent hydrolase (beta-lactamase superfamily II)